VAKATLWSGIDAEVRKQGKQYEGASNWSKKYVAWVARIDFGEESLGQVRNGYLDTIENLGSEVKDLDKRLELIAGKPRYASRMEKLRLFRGIGVLTGMALLLEVGDFNRFATAKSFMAWVGLVPSEKSSGNTKKQGNITKAGNGYLRTLLVEAAWHYAFKGKFKDPRIGVGSTLGQEYVEYAHRADRRLQNKLYQLYYWKKRPKNIATTAVARELAGFIWGMMTEQVALRKA